GGRRAVHWPRRGARSARRGRAEPAPPRRRARSRPVRPPRPRGGRAGGRRAGSGRPSFLGRGRGRDHCVSVAAPGELLEPLRIAGIGCRPQLGRLDLPTGSVRACDRAERQQRSHGGHGNEHDCGHGDGECLLGHGASYESGTAPTLGRKGFARIDENPGPGQVGGFPLRRFMRRSSHGALLARGPGSGSRSGFARSRLERVLVAAAYALALLGYPPSELSNDVNTALSALAIALVPFVVYLVVDRWLRATPADRRALRPLVLVGPPVLVVVAAS